METWEKSHTPVLQFGNNLKLETGSALDFGGSVNKIEKNRRKSRKIENIMEFRERGNQEET
jgi:hypothetical protein